MRMKICLPVIAVFSVLIIASVILLGLFNTFIDSEIVSKTSLVPGSALYDQWSQATLPIYLQFFIFNLTNPNDFKSGKPPHVVQLGPYTYLERRSKESIVYNGSAATLSYKEHKEYIFIPSLSNGTDGDSVTSINLVYLQIVPKIEKQSWFIRQMVEYMESKYGDNLIISQTVDQFLWGREDKLLKLLRKFISIATDKVGVYAGKNNTDDGVVVIDNGAEQLQNLGHILSYHSKPALSCWSTPSANQINGSDGSLFPPFQDFTGFLDVFASDIYRSIRFRPQKKTQLKGVPVFKYLPQEDTFESPLHNPNNRGFCYNESGCLGDGLLDFSRCSGAAFIIGSLPHFWLANATVQKSVHGLRPSEEFNTTFYVNPKTGVILKAAKKFQINILVERNSKFKELSDLNTVIFPLFFINESFVLDDETTRQLWLAVEVTPMAIYIGVPCLIGVLVLACVILCIVYFRQRSVEASSEDEATLIH